MNNFLERAGQVTLALIGLTAGVIAISTLILVLTQV